jgi:uncharacterized damage-inducible protein DinB
MAFTDALLPEFDHEMATTRKLLERLPEARLGWKPHQRSMSLGRLATHLAEIPRWSKHFICEDEIDLKGDYQPNEERSVAAILSLFDTSVAESRKMIAGRSDAELMAPWTFKAHGKTMFTMPRAAVMRSMLFNHMVHHRGQLSVYLRLNDVPLPAMYGPTADEGGR